MKKLLLTGKYKFCTLIIVFIALMACNYSYAKTIYVTTTGNDTTGTGTSTGTAFRSIQRALDHPNSSYKAQAGDTILVGAGTFYERVVFNSSNSEGTSTKRITLQGTLDGNGNPITTIDAGRPLTNWTDVGGTGNVWRTPLPAGTDRPYAVNMNGYYILNLTPATMAGTLDAPNDDINGLDMMHNGPISWNTSYGQYSSEVRSWNRGVNALWGYFSSGDSNLYMGFGDPNINPNNENITYALRNKAGGACVTIGRYGDGTGRDFITVKNFNMINAHSGILVRQASQDCIVENNAFYGGQHCVNIMEGCNRIIVRNNYMTLDYDNGNTLSSDDPNHWFIWKVFKEYSDHDRLGVSLEDGSNGVEIYDNYIYEHWDGIQDTEANVNLKVYGNTIENIEDDGLEPTGDEQNAQWYDNTVIRADYSFRHKDNSTGPMYVYRNKFYNAEEGGIYWFSGNTGPAYYYHNTIVTDRGMTFGSQNTVGYPNVWLINNIFSNNANITNDNWDAGTYPHFDYNYVGGNLSIKKSWMGNNNKIVLNGQLWSANPPDFEITSTSPARQMGLDLSQPWTIGSTTYPALPGMEPGYYEGTVPDAGAFQYEAPKVSVTINQSASQLDPSNGSTVVFDVVFSKPISGFLSNDIILSGTAGATTAVLTSSGDYMNYSVTVSGMTQSGTVIASIPALAAWDKTNSAYKSAASTSTDNIVDYDITSPSVTINQDVAQLDPTTTSPILFKAVFSEPVTGFTSSDIVLSGTAQASSVVITDSGDHKNYSISVSGFTQTGTVVATIPAGSAQDGLGNLSAASSSTDNTITYNGIVPPTVTINQDTSQLDPATTSPIVFKVVFSKPISGFLSNDIILSGSAGATTAVLTSIGDYMNYSVAVSGMTQSGTVIASIPALAVWDKVNSANKSVASTSTDNVVVYSDSVTVSGSIDLQSFYADKSGVSGTVDIRDSASGEVIESHPITLDASGNYSFTTSRTGDYTLAAKCSHWLSDAKNVAIAVSGNVVNFSLINGDCNNDNAVDEGDFGMLSNAWYSSVGDPNFNARTDLNADGAIDEGDFGILSNAWYQSGN